MSALMVLLHIGCTKQVHLIGADGFVLIYIRGLESDSRILGYVHYVKSKSNQLQTHRLSYNSLSTCATMLSMSSLLVFIQI